MIPLGVVTEQKTYCENKLNQIAPHILGGGLYSECPNFDAKTPCSLEGLVMPTNDNEYFTWAIDMSQEYLNDVVTDKLIADTPL